MPPLRIVVVDDDDAIRPIICSLALDAVPGAIIKEHTSSFHALSDVERGAELLITDYHMPGMDGIMLVQAIRRVKNSIPIIMVSGSDEARELGEKAGIDRFVQKIRLTADIEDAIYSLDSLRFPCKKEWSKARPSE